MKKRTSILLFVALIIAMSSYSQSLEWAEKTQLNDSIYLCMEEIVQSEPIAMEKFNFFKYNSLFELVEELRTKKQRKKELDEVLQQHKEDVQKFMHEHFVFHDTKPVLFFSDEEEIRSKWCRPYSQAKLQSFDMRGKKVTVLSDTWGSGLIRTTFDVFEENNGLLELLTSSTLFHSGTITPVEIKVSEDQTALVFSSSTVILSELKIAEQNTVQ